jgi:hypothetical protein
VALAATGLSQGENHELKQSVKISINYRKLLSGHAKGWNKKRRPGAACLVGVESFLQEIK